MKPLDIFLRVKYKYKEAKSLNFKCFRKINFISNFNIETKCLFTNDNCQSTVIKEERPNLEILQLGYLNDCLPSPNISNNVLTPN